MNETGFYLSQELYASAHIFIYFHVDIIQHIKCTSEGRAVGKKGRDNAVGVMILSGRMKRTTNISVQLVYTLTLEDIYCDNSHS